MSNSQLLKELLERNRVHEHVFSELIYTSLIISLLEVIIEEMESKSVELDVKKRIMASKNKEVSIRNLVKEYTNCIISLNEANQLLKYITAYLNKSTSRKPVSFDLKSKILHAQNLKCGLCNKQITINNIEIDHIIPFRYVGDELGSDNLQGLCRECNRRKSKSINFNLRMFLISRND